MTTVDLTFDEFPYNHAGSSLEFDIESYELNDRGVQDVCENRQISLFEGPEWDTVVLEVSVAVEERTLEHVFPDHDNHEGVLVVTGYCPSTHYRFVEPVMWDNFDAGTHHIDFSIDRDQLREEVVLTPKLLRNSSGPDSERYASAPGRELATGPSWKIFVDEPRLGLDGNLPVEAAKFSERPDLGSASSEWYIDTRRAEEPKLWLNKDYPFVVDVLDASDGQSPRGTVGRVVLKHLAVPMLTQFTIKAAQHAIVTGDIEHRWQETLLTDVCEDYFGADPAIEELEEYLAPEAIPTSISEIDDIMQRRQKPQEDVQTLLGMIGDD